MKALRRYQNLRVSLLLSAILLAAQTLLFWHTHHGHVTPDDSCQICVHAQHHTPATNSIQATTLSLFVPVAVSEPQTIETSHYVYRIYIPSRAPPVLPLA
ncbi:MAG: hypothetical protein GC149_11670 [Gammaproteobacteria bacterium]|nr:hypothetical protein [Gammaproteobacteria bacterium]